MFQSFRSLVCVLALTAGALVQASDDDGIYTKTNTMFTNQFRSMWDGGTARVEVVFADQTSWNYYTHWDGTFDICTPEISLPWPLPDIPAFCIGKTGIDFTLDTNGIVGGGGFAYATAGDASCTQFTDAKVTFNLPDTVPPGFPIGFTDSQTLNPAGFSNLRLSSPNAGLGLLARLRAHLYINVSAYIFGYHLFDETPFNFTFDSADLNPNPKTIFGLIGPIRVRRDDLGYVNPNAKDYKMMEIFSTDWPLFRIIILAVIAKDPKALLPKAFPDHITNMITVQFLDPTYIKLFKPTEAAGIITYDTYPYTYPPPITFSELPPPDPLFKQFVVVRASLTNAIVVLMGFPFGWNRDYNIGGVQLTFRLFDIYTKLEFGYEQHFVFRPKLRVNLQVNQPDGSAFGPNLATSAVIGTPGSINMPTGVDYARVVPSLFIDSTANDFTNRTDVKITVTDGFALLRFTFGHPDIGLIDFPNQFGVNLDWYLYVPINIKVYENSFNLGGFTNFPNQPEFKIYPAIAPVIVPPDVTTALEDGGVNKNVAARLAANSSGEAPIPNVITASPQPYPIPPLSNLTVTDNYVSYAQITKTQDVPAGTMKTMNPTDLFTDYPIVITCRDVQGNTRTATTYLRIVDLTPPIFTNVPLPRIVHHKTGNPADTPVKITLATAVDNVDSSPVVEIVGHESLVPTVEADLSRTVTINYPIGTTAIIYNTRDLSGNSRQSASTVTVLNSAPVASFVGGPYVVNEGSSIGVQVTATDPAAAGEPGTESDPLTYAWDLDKNGSFETAGASATYNAIDGPSIKTVRAQVLESMFRGNTVVANANVTILNVAPEITGPIVAPTDPVKAGTPVHVSVPFKDVGILDTHTVTWDWGDGSVTSGTVSEAAGFGLAFGTHAYTIGGMFTVTVTVTDNDGDSDAAVYKFVLIYDAAAGKVVGKGKFQVTPAMTPALNGPATFTLSVLYKPGYNVPTGTATLTFTLGTLKFKSTLVGYLGLAGTKAHFKGTGTNNGTGSFEFFCTVKDDVVGGDKIRFKIWTPGPTPTVLFDTQPGAADDAAATTPLISGNIVISPP